MLNLFSLHGKYFQDDENRFTANFLVILSESRSAVLPAFLRSVGIVRDGNALKRVHISFQSRFELGSAVSIPDAELRLEEDMHLLVEAKIAQNGLDSQQLASYARYLSQSSAREKRMVCITQINDLHNFNSIVSKNSTSDLPPENWYYFQWYKLLDLIKSSLRLTSSDLTSLDRNVLNGVSVGHAERLATLFLKEVESSMYDRKVVDEIASGELADIVVTTQDPWFMSVAKKWCIWFPSGATSFGLSPARYVAYYETNKEGNENPRAISYIARNVIFWNRVTLGDARRLKELKNLFADREVNNEISRWYKEDQTFHVALTEKPVKLKHRISLGKRNLARVLSRRRYSMIKLMNAGTIDDLF